MSYARETEYRSLLITADQTAVRIMLNRPDRRNPLSLELMGELISALYAQVDRTEHDAYEHCKVVMAQNAVADDAQEGIDAFLRKRAPVWRGE